MSVKIFLKFLFPGSMWLVLSTWKPHRKTQKHTSALSTHIRLSSITLDSRSLPLGFSVLAHDERQTDANERKQDSFSSFQQIICWSYRSGNTLHRPLLSLSLFSQHTIIVEKGEFVCWSRLLLFFLIILSMLGPHNLYLQKAADFQWLISPSSLFVYLCKQMQTFIWCLYTIQFF